jgi:hypothetical protein
LASQLLAQSALWSAQRVLFLRAEPAVVSLISSAIMAVLGLMLNGIQA